MRALVKRSASVNVDDDDGDTPLMMACDENHLTITQLLIDAAVTKSLQQDIPVTL